MKRYTIGKTILDMTLMSLATISSAGLDLLLALCRLVLRVRSAGPPAFAAEA